MLLILLKEEGKPIMPHVPKLFKSNSGIIFTTLTITLLAGVVDNQGSDFYFTFR